MKKLLVFLLIAFISTSVFARGGSSFGGGGGFRGSSFSSGSFRSSSFSAPRASISSGYGRGSSNFGSYRSYTPSYRSSNTTIINHGGYGGGGFFSGLLLGGMISNSGPSYNSGYSNYAQPAVVSGVTAYGPPMQDYGMAYYLGNLLTFIIFCLVLWAIGWVLYRIFILGNR